MQSIGEVLKEKSFKRLLMADMQKWIDWQNWFNDLNFAQRKRFSKMIRDGEKPKGMTYPDWYQLMMSKFLLNEKKENDDE